MVQEAKKMGPNMQQFDAGTHEVSGRPLTALHVLEKGTPS